MASKRICKYNVGDSFETTDGNTCTIISTEVVDDTPRIKVRFVDTGFETTVSVQSVNSGKIRDWKIPSVAGVGYCSTLEGIHRCCTKGGRSVNTPAYSAWRDMLSRCYDTRNKRYNYYGGVGVTVCDEWLDFVNFHVWFMKNGQDGMHVDKDILSPRFRGKCYSPENCACVPACVNNFLISKRKNRGIYPVGVRRINTKSGLVQYVARVGNLEGGYNYLGRFETMHEAFMAYKVAREGLAKKLAEREYTKGTISKEVYERMLGWQAVPYP